MYTISRKYSKFVDTIYLFLYIMRILRNVFQDLNSLALRLS